MTAPLTSKSHGRPLAGVVAAAKVPLTGRHLLFPLVRCRDRQSRDKPLPTVGTADSAAATVITTQLSSRSRRKLIAVRFNEIKVSIAQFVAHAAAAADAAAAGSLNEFSS